MSDKMLLWGVDKTQNAIFAFCWQISIVMGEIYSVISYCRNTRRNKMMLDTIPMIIAYPIPTPNIARADAIRDPAKMPIHCGAISFSLLGNNISINPVIV
jgi:hypothetical protein